ncbi:hypothetical protein SMICM304S_12139 [Streptomyces microflavus]
MTAPRPSLTLSSTVLEAPDAAELADFYRRLLGWETVQEEPDWVKLLPPGGGSGLGFQTSKPYVPVWPASLTSQGDQLMMLHLDFEVTDLEAGVAHAVAEGATPAEFQPQGDVRVLFDPVGHPFCLFVRDHVLGETPAMRPRVGRGAAPGHQDAEPGGGGSRDAGPPGGGGHGGAGLRGRGSA